MPDVEFLNEAEVTKENLAALFRRGLTVMVILWSRQTARVFW